MHYFCLMIGFWDLGAQALQLLYHGGCTALGCNWRFLSEYSEMCKCCGSVTTGHYVLQSTLEHGSLCTSKYT